MPRISHVRNHLEYTVYEGDHRKVGRWFGLVHRGETRVFNTVIDAANQSEALQKLKDEYSKKPRTPDPAVHHIHD